VRRSIMYVANIKSSGIEFTHLLTEPLFGKTTTTALQKNKSYYYPDGSILIADPIIGTSIQRYMIRSINSFGQQYMGKTNEVGLHCEFEENGTFHESNHFVSKARYDGLTSFCESLIQFALSTHFYALFLYHKAVLQQIDNAVLSECLSYFNDGLASETTQNISKSILKSLAKDPVIYAMSLRSGTSSVLHRVYELLVFFAPILNNSIYLLDQRLENILINTKIKLTLDEIHLPQNGTAIAFQKPILSFTGSEHIKWDVYSVIITKSVDKLMFCVLCRCALSWDIHYFNIDTVNNTNLLCDMPDSLINFPREIFDAESVLRIINLSLCSILYIINHPSCIKYVPEEDEIKDKISKMKNIKKIDKLKKRIQNTINYSYIYPSNSVEKYNESISKHSSTTRNNPFKIVAGHFKNQPYGKQRLLRKHIWVKPYIKGKDTEATIPESIQIKKVRA